MDKKRELYKKFIDILRPLTADADACATPLADVTPLADTTPLADVTPLAYAEAMARQLVLQLRVLEREGFSLLFWRESDILVFQQGAVPQGAMPPQPPYGAVPPQPPYGAVPPQPPLGADLEALTLLKTHLSECYKGGLRGHSPLLKTHPLGGSRGHSPLFLLANLEHLVPLNSKGQMRINFPIRLPPELVAPELLKITALPFDTHLSASYYSLALLCLRTCAVNSLAEIAQTKLFYFLERCLKPEPTERCCVFL